MIGYGNSVFLRTAWEVSGGVPPVNTVAPAITGTAQEGQIVTCSTGTWTGTPTITFAYQWKRNGSNIGSATNSTYTLVTADVSQSITCQVTATNGSGSASATSNTITPIAAFTGLLDTYPSAAVAYSLRQLSSTYTGNAIRVRRSSDNAEQDFGFVDNVLDTASLLTFCGAGNGFVTTWYDQSGNANNGVQTTAINQARIVSSGSLITINTKSAIESNAGISFYSLTNSFNFGANHYNSFVGLKGSNLNNFYGLGGTRYFFANFSDSNYYLFGNTSGFQQSNSTDNIGPTYTLLTGLKDLTGMKMYKNTSLIASSFVNLSYAASIDSIGSYNGGNFHGGKYQEIVFYNSDQSSNRAGIESNINTFYSIY